MFKSLRIGLWVTVIGLIVSAGFSSVQAQSGKKIVLAVHAPLTGDAAGPGKGFLNAAKLVVEQRGDALRKMGFELEVVAFDDQSKPDVGVENAKKIIENPDILAVIGHYNSGVALKTSEVYATANLVMVSPSNTNPQITDRGLSNVNRVCGRDDIQGARVGGAFLDFARDRLNVKTVYILHSNTPYGKEIAEFFQSAAKERGVRILGFEIAEDLTNFDKAIIPIKAQNPNLVYWGGEFSGGLLVKQMRERGISSIFSAGDGIDDGEFAKIAGKDAIGTYFTTTSGPAENFPRARDFVATYKRVYKAAPPPFSTQAYDATHITLLGIERAVKDGKVPTREEVMKAIRATRNFRGLTANITFDEKGDPVKAPYYLVKVTSADPKEWGKNEIIQTFEVEAPPLPKK
jgi:branched-chain amino acid transport system substrate-binding protein